jgi:selenocysteine lyase/cysteine desulfurase
MTSTNTRSTPTPSSAADFAFPQAVVLDNFRNMLDAGQNLFRGWAAINSEMVDFASQQLKQNAEAWSQTHSLDETLKAQTEAARAAIAQYFDAAGKLMTISTQAITESCATLQKGQSKNGVDASGAKAPKTAAAA